ncbi:hypothetical protein [Nonomuraea sp. NPDC050786]|uniref:hypothetical protein n=1 Tax=Nonomuraea sp. NPDC050786 TaxID=3154840 RepID=UPI0033C4388B
MSSPIIDQPARSHMIGAASLTRTVHTAGGPGLGAGTPTCAVTGRWSLPHTLRPEPVRS